MNSELHHQLSYKKAYREQRLKAARWVLANPNTFRELLVYCFDPSEDEIAHKANWVLEFVLLEKFAILYPHLDLFFTEISKIKKDQSLRPLSHICELLAIKNYKEENIQLQKVFKQEHKEKMIQCCFDWLLTDQKIACQVRAMTALYYLGTEFKWIHPELSEIIESNILSASAGYQARGKRILKHIKRFKGTKKV